MIMSLNIILNNLIFDRITKDIEEGSKKGYYNYNDLNRIETWCQYISDWLNYYKYSNHIYTKTNWNMYDIPYNSELERIRGNIQILKTSFKAISEVPENLNRMTIEKANTVEKIIFEIDYILQSMESYFIYCGVSGCGQERIWQQRFRKLKTWNAEPYKILQYTMNDTLKNIATQCVGNIPIHTSKLSLTQLDKRDDVFLSIEDFNSSMEIIDELVGN